MNLAVERPSMLITLVHSNPQLNISRIDHDLSVRFGLPSSGLLTAIDVRHPDSAARDLALPGNGLVIAGGMAHEYVMRKMPRGFRVRRLDYGALQPILYVIDAPAALQRFDTAVYWPDPAALSGRNVFNACVFSMEELSLRERLYIHLARRHFAAYEASIFGSQTLQ